VQKKPRKPIKDTLKEGGDGEGDDFEDDEDFDLKRQNKTNYAEPDDDEFLAGDQAEKPNRGRGRPRKDKKYPTTIDGLNYKGLGPRGKMDDNVSEGKKRPNYYEGHSSEGKGGAPSQSSISRNEKNGIYCHICHHPEPPTCQWLICVGNCKRYFHEECVKKVDPDIENVENKYNWRCTDCRSQLAVCFFCKQKGPI
jgi:hypothetical protein